MENYFFPADLEAQIEAFVDHYNHQRLPRKHQQPHPPQTSVSGVGSQFQKTEEKYKPEKDGCRALAIPQKGRLIY